MNDSLDFAPDSIEERLYRRQMRQTRICVWVIMLGLTNFFLYAIGYWYFYGEAVHGHVYGTGAEAVYLLHSGRAVSRGAFIYSGIHSISIWLTVGAVLLAMLTLAKERIVSSESRAILRGRTLLTVIATIITVTVALVTVEVTLEFIRNLRHPNPLPVPTEILDTNDTVGH